MPKMLVQLTPKPLKKPLEWLYNRIRYFGFACYCPVCETYLRSFKRVGIAPWGDWGCPLCKSSTRHRMAWLFFKHRTNLFNKSPKKMLHVGPEKQFETRLKKVPALDYITADLKNPNAMVKMDITNIQFTDNTFDIIFCSHVLEHVADDRKAMHELHRVLKPAGWSAIMVPLRDEKTFEDHSITDPAERKRIFGEADHVRRYGLDIKDRLEEAGFNVEVFLLADVVTGDNTARFGVKNQRVFFCKKSNPDRCFL